MLNTAIRRLRTVLHVARVWRNSMAAIVLAGGLLSIAAMCLAILLTPSQQVHAFGQVVTIGAQPPNIGPGGTDRISEGAQPPLYLSGVQISGLIRPSLSLTPEPSREIATLFSNSPSSIQARAGAGWTLATGLMRWAGLATLICAILMFFILRRVGRRMSSTGKSKWRSRIAMLIVAIVASGLWFGSVADATVSSAPITHSNSLSKLFGQVILPPDAPVAAPKHREQQPYQLVVLGDSRAARSGGPAMINPSPTDRACPRSRDSLSAWMEWITGERSLNLACPSASIRAGILGPQSRGGREITPQIDEVSLLRGVKTIIVMIGPNDVWWSTQLGLCYATVHCFDKLTSAAFQVAMDQFTQDYLGTQDSLLERLSRLPGHPQVIINLSYSPFNSNASCADTRGPKGLVGLNQTGGRPSDKIVELQRRNAQLNSILQAGAELFGFQTSMAHLTPLCANDPMVPTPDIQGIRGAAPFHPTWHGEEMIAVGDALAMTHANSTSPGSSGAGTAPSASQRWGPLVFIGIRARYLACARISRYNEDDSVVSVETCLGTCRDLKVT